MTVKIKIGLRVAVATALVAAVLPAVVGTGSASADTAPVTGATRTGAVGDRTGTITMPSGMVQTLTTVDGTGGAANSGASTTLLDLAGTVSSTGAQTYDPALPATTPAFRIQTNLPADCDVAETCTGLGTLTLSFNQPVMNPTLHISGLGSFASQSGTAGTRGHDRLTLSSSAPAGATLGSVAAGSTNLRITGGDTIDTVTPTQSTACDANQGTPVSTAFAGCGSVTVNGTVTSLTFALSETSVAVGGSTADPAAEAFNIIASVKEDQGDAPASYDAGTAAANTIGDLKLGASVDADSTAAVNPAAAASAVAAGADNNGPYGDGTDENAFAASNPPIIPASVIGVVDGYSVTVPISGASKPGAVCGWIDFDKDAAFAAGERSCSTFVAAATSVTLQYTVPAGTSTGATYARFRAAYGTAATLASATGRVDSGETEDYRITIAQSAPLACSTVYALQGASPRNIYAVASGTGALSATGSQFGSQPDVADGTAFNALGISNDGNKSYSVATTTASAAVRNIYELDRSTGTSTQVAQITIPAPTLLLLGAVNPRTGIYYFGGYNGSSLDIYGYDPATGTVLGQVGTSTTVAVPGSNGDLTFDEQNHLYIVTASSTRAVVSVINEELPTTVGSPITFTGKPVVTIDDPASTNTLAVGLAFGGQGDRRLYLSSGSTIRAINPSTGEIEATQAFNGAATNGINDLASCSSPNTLWGQASFPDGRFAAGDQATVTITGGGLAAGVTGTTAGADTGLQNNPAETAGPVFGLDGTAYTVTQAGLSTDHYAVTYSCTNVNTGDVLTSGTGNVATFTMPSDQGADGTAAYCLFTDTALEPAITLDKQAGTPSGNSVGSTVPYTFLVTNTGNVVLSSVSVSDPKAGTVSCPTGTLAPGASRTCTATYTLTQADVNAGQVVNTATATGVPSTPGLPDATASDTNTLTVARNPVITLVKNASPSTGADGRLNVNDTVAYTFVVTNTGNVTLTAVGVNDAKVGTVSCPATTLAPGDSTTCTAASYVVTQTDVDAGKITNTATVSGTPPSGAAVTASATRLVSTSTLKGISLNKTNAAPVDQNANGRVDAGDRISFSFVVTNTGDVTLSSVTVADPKVVGLSCPVTTLAAGATTTCTAAPYVITQADVDSGAVDNTATVSGTPPTGAPTTGTDTNSVTTSTAATISLAKSAGTPVDVDANGRVDAGDTIAYSFVVTNTGPLTLSQVAVTDAKVGTVTCPVTTLSPAASTTCTAGYTITQADVNTGSVHNTATAAGSTPASTRITSAPATATTPTSTLRSITVDKEVGSVTDVDTNGRTDAGDKIGYTFLVTNTGAQTLTSVVVNDPKIAGASCPVTTLQPGGSTTCTGTYTVTQAEVNSGAVNNSATASGTPPTGAPTTSAPDATSTPTSTISTLSLLKSAGTPADVDTDGRTDAGDTISYSFVVTNTGAQTLTSVAVADPKIGAVTCPATTLAPAAEVTCTKSYVITQEDVDGGSVANTATATGLNPAAATISSPPSSTTTPTSTAATLSLTKSAGTPADVDADGRTDAGDTIAYSFLLTNTGAVTLSAVSVDDPKIGVVTCPSTTLAPAASVTCTKGYTITQADVNSGSVDNTATASGTPPTGPAITSNPSSTTTPTSTLRSLSIDKVASAPSDVDDNGRTDAGDTITYSFLVTNTGAQTLTDVAVDDPMLAPVTCAVTTLQPGASVTCTKGYTITQGDVNGGSVDNTATASGTPPTGPAITSTPDSTSTPTSTLRAIGLDKQAGAPADVDDNGRTDAGDTILFSFVVTNDGAQTLTSVEVDDPKVGAVTCPPGSLAPGESVTCTKAYTITQADVDSGSVDNTATASGTPPTGPAITSTPDSTSTPTSTTSTLTIDKSAGTVVDVDDDSLVDVGDQVPYTFVVTNTGAVTLTSVVVDDDLVPGASCPVSVLAPAASTTCSGTYTITQADADLGVVDNTATASGTPPTGPTTTSAPDSTSTPVDVVESLAFDKSAATPSDTDGDGTAEVGDTIAYTFLVTNTGTVTQSSVVVIDDKVGAVTCPSTATLVSGASLTCSATYTITQLDVDAGAVDNTARAQGTPPSDEVTESPTDSTSTPLVRTPSIDLDETAAPPLDLDGNGRIDAGDSVAYSFLVTNTGNVTLTNVTVTDGHPGTVSCPTSVLAVGAATTCTHSYTLTQDDLDAGQVVNPSTVVGTAPTGTNVTDDDTETTALDAVASISLDETASAPFDANGSGVINAGDSIDYSYVITNTGTVTLSNVSLSDDLVGTVISCPTTKLAPGASMTCSSSYTIQQADLDAGQVVNPASVVGTPPAGADVTDDDSETTPLETTSSIDLDETAAPALDVDGNGVIDAGDTIDYSFVVTNTGGVTLTDVAVTDGLPGTVVCPVSTLLPGVSVTCTVTYTLTQDDLDAGQVTNPATAAGTPPTGPAVTDDDVESTALTTFATVALDETAAAPVDIDANGTIDAGDTVDYAFVVTNTGTVTLTGIAVSDGLDDTTVQCPATTLLPGVSTTCTATHVLTQAELDAGAVTNPATAVGTPPSGPDVTDDDVETTPLMPVALISVDETAATPVDTVGDGTIGAGDTVDYTFVVTNTGTVTLTGVAVSDGLDDTTVQCPVTTLLPGVSTTCAATHVLTQAELDAGAVTNPATAVGTPPSGPEVTDDDSETTPLEQTPSIALDETAMPPFDANATGTINAGDTVTYDFLVTNTGTVTLTGVTVDDGLPGTVVCPLTTLAPGASTTCVLTYTLTQADLDAGTLTNAGVAVGTPPSGPDVTDDDSETTPLEQTPSIALDETAMPPFDANGTGTLDAGDTVTYGFLVTNTGGVTLTGVTVDDGLPGTPVCVQTTLAPGESTMCTVVYTLTQGDLDAGQVVNPATAFGTPPFGADVSAPDSETTTLPTQPAIDLDESVGPVTDTNGNGAADAVDTVTFSFLVTNTGAVTLTGVVVDDGLPGTVVCPQTTLVPGESMTCTYLHTLTQDEIDAGQVTDPATATGTPPTGPDVTDLDIETAPLGAVASVVLDKQAGEPVDANGDELLDVGDTVDYTFVVTNTGNVTLTGVAVDDPLLTVACPVTTLAPGETTTCTGTYTLTAADVASGTVLNTASVVAVDPADGGVVSPSDGTATPVPDASLTLDKRVRRVLDVDDNGPDAGDRIVYELVVTNSGDERVSDVEVDDPMLAAFGLEVTCPAGALRPDETVTCVAEDYTITADDGANGEVVNEAIATAVASDGGTVESNRDTVTTDLDIRHDGIYLPGTGTSIEPWQLGSGLALLLGGLVLLVGGRRRRRKA